MQSTERASWFCRVSGLAAFVAVVTVGGLGLAKLADLPAFIDNLGTWTLLPRTLVAPVAVVVPTVEATLAILWLAGSQRRAVACALLGFVALVTGFFLLQTLLAERPTCGCLGPLTAYLDLKESVGGVLVRNAAILLTLAQWLWLSRWRAARAGAQTRIEPA